MHALATPLIEHMLMQVKCWGLNNFGQLGLGHRNDMGDALNETGEWLPYVNLGTNRTAKQISAALQHTCALLDTNQIK
jgi:hypothetical protein